MKREVNELSFSNKEDKRGLSHFSSLFVSFSLNIFRLFGLVLIILALFVPVSFSIPEVIIYGDVNRTDCINTINSIPDVYYEGIKQIRISNTGYGAFYSYGGIIVLRSNCNLDFLIHELAHHKNFKEKIRSNHGSEFQKAESEIWGVILCQV